MDQIADFFSNGYTMIGMAVLAAALIGLLLFIRNQPKSDE